MVMPALSLNASAAAVSRVSGIKHTSENYTITLKWSKTSGAKYYRIYKYNPAKDSWSWAATTNKTSHTLTGFASAKTYLFKIRAYKSSKIYGKFSSVYTATTAPNQVENLRISSYNTDAIKIKWDTTKRATGFQVYKYIDGKWKLLKDVSTNTYTDKKLQSATEYKYKVRAYYRNGSSVSYGQFSDVLTAVTRPETPMSFDVAESTNAGYTLSWKGAGDVDKYCIYVNNNGEWVKIATVAGETYDVADSSGSINTYIVRAVYASEIGNIYSPYSNTVAACCANSPVGIQPEVPKDFEIVANPDKGCINLSWEPVEGATGYQVYAYDAASGEWLKVKTTTSTAFAYNVTETATYYFKVRSYVTAEGENVYSNYTESQSVDFESKGVSANDIIAALEKNGILGYLYDFEGQYFYTASDPWQRNFGFSPIYDYAAPFTSMVYTTRRLYFSYDNIDWMIQTWKGQYGIVIGAEVGVYTKTPDADVLDFYECADDENSLKMSMIVKLDDTVIIDRPYGTYWWCTGFIPNLAAGNTFIYMEPWITKLSGNVKTDRMSMIVRITLKSEGMRDAFRVALEEKGISYVYSGCDVIFTWQTGSDPL